MWLCAGDTPLSDFLAPRACALVPTMGALPPGHAALIRRAADHANAAGLPAGAVVTIFVNPTQFDDPADFARYARTLPEDLELCRNAGAAGVFAPSPERVYPPESTIPVPALATQAIAKGLEDTHRPGHFAGVCQVVRRLFDLTSPHAAVFGEKDWQQLQVIRAMTSRDRLGVEIIPAPTIREPDGLAMSSRNRFLTPPERRTALALRRALDAAREHPTPDAGEAAMRRVLEQAPVDRIDYATIRDAETLDAPTPGRPARALITARVGTVRLLDNAPWP